MMIPIIIAIVINMMLGMYWYSPKLFGPLWARELGFQLNDMKPGPEQYSAALIVNIMIVMALFVLVQFFNIQTIVSAVEIALISWLGLIASTHFSAVIWCKKPLKVYLIEIGYLFVVVFTNVLLLALWR